MNKKLNKRYWEFRKELFLIGHDASQAFDKIIIGFSTAGLGVFFYSIEKALSLFWLYILGGMLLVIAISNSLYSLKKSEDSNIICPSATSMVQTQALSGVAFVLALIVFILFIFLIHFHKFYFE